MIPNYGSPDGKALGDREGFLLGTRQGRKAFLRLGPRVAHHQRPAAVGRGHDLLAELRLHELADQAGADGGGLGPLAARGIGGLQPGPPVVEQLPGKSRRPLVEHQPDIAVLAAHLLDPLRPQQLEQGPPG